MTHQIIETRLLDFSHHRISRLFAVREWDSLDAESRLRNLYEFVRDEIPFGYNRAEIIPASGVLDEGMGQCNTKGILLMALLRRAGFPCRFHAFRVTKQVQAGVMPRQLHKRLPDEIQHSWVEVYHNDQWLNMEGFILDGPFLEQVQRRFSEWSGSFCGFAVGVDDLLNPLISWTGGDTYIQHKAITGDLGVYDSPDEFYATHGSNIAGLKGLLWRWLYYRSTNANVEAIRRGHFPENAETFVEKCPSG